MTMLTYLISSLVWSLGGFLAGYVFARMTFDVHAIREHMVTTHDDNAHTTPRRVRPHLPPRLLGVVLVLLAVASVTAAAVTTMRQREVVECQADVNRRVVETIAARQHTINEDREALTRVVEAVVKERNVDEALQDYLAASRAAQQSRERYTYPDPEDFDCH